MHAANSSSKPLIPLLNLDNVTLPKDGEEEIFAKNAQLEDLIQVDTGKLVSPTPGRQHSAANEVDYDMSSYESSSRYQALENHH